LEFLLLAIDQIGLLYKASKVAFYVVDKRFSSRMVKQTGKNAEKTASCDITKLSLDNQPITAIYKDKEHHCQPVFRTLPECYLPIKQKNVFYISHKRPHSGKLTVGI
jgi:hypothetical protein